MTVRRVRLLQQKNKLNRRCGRTLALVRHSCRNKNRTTFLLICHQVVKRHWIAPLHQISQIYLVIGTSSTIDQIHPRTWKCPTSNREGKASWKGRDLSTTFGASKPIVLHRKSAFIKKLHATCSKLLPRFGAVVALAQHGDTSVQHRHQGH